MSRKISLLLIVIFVLFCCSGCLGRLSWFRVNTIKLKPTQQWRHSVIDAKAQFNGDELLSNLNNLTDASIEVNGFEGWFSIKVPQITKPCILTFRPRKNGIHYLLEVSSDSTNGSNGTWQKIGQNSNNAELNQYLRKVDITPELAGKWVKVKFFISNLDKIQVTDIGFYQLNSGKINDYWVSTGASIQHQSIRNEHFKQMVKERFGFDPVIFNTAISGWTTQDLKEAMPSILAFHPYAKYVTIHIGGNDVSGNRPYPRGKDMIEANLRSICQMVRDAGKEPILCRLSYRAYKGSLPVPPEENGSGPYVTNIYDPLIKELCPYFYDYQNDIGLVDAYGWFRDHPEELSSDGIHVNPTGEISWNRIWAHSAGNVVYNSK